MTSTDLVTADQFLVMPEERCRYELIRGELIELPFAFMRQSSAAVRLGTRVLDYAEEHGGDVTLHSGYLFHVDPDTVLAPDVAYLRPEHIPPKEEWDRYPRVAPDLIVEVVSQNEPEGHLGRKLDEYLAAGVPMMLIVDMDRRLATAYNGEQSTVLDERDAFDGDAVMPGFRLPLHELFR